MKKMSRKARRRVRKATNLIVEAMFSGAPLPKGFRRILENEKLKESKKPNMGWVQ